MDTETGWHTLKYHLHAVLAAVLMAGTAQGCVASAAPGPAWQAGGLDSLIHSFWEPAAPKGS